MKLLIVSFRNTCRGPMAAGLAGRIAAQQGLVLEIETAGMASNSKGFVAPLAVEAMTGLGVDISQHRSTPVTPELLQSADVVVAVEPDLAVGLRLQYPDTAEKVLELGGDVPDPHRPGATLSDYVACRDLLEALLRRLPIYAPYGRAPRGDAVRIPPFGRGSRSQGPLSCRSGVS
jgi:protein-tyrosine-phosphatase